MAKRSKRITLVGQRKKNDCGVAALAAYLHLAYEDTYAAAVRLVPTAGSHGLLVRELSAVAESLGRTLRVVRKPDLDAQKGILGINWTNRKAHGGSYGHWVVLDEGRILDGAELWDVDEYLATEGGRAGWLLTDENERGSE